jgi:hypothetical protein
MVQGKMDIHMQKTETRTPPLTLYKNQFGRVPVAHDCNPSYSGSRDQEDLNLKPDPILKNLHKKGLVEWLKVKALSSSSNTEKKKSIQSGSQTLMEGLRL